ncbi:LysR substrate-binding domain-containing protein [Aurantiacibacter sp. MUD11]|uniref:LysR family transcriptional regulator n=1 Tax=Aurantiacibacter sp. MUD11 TaxID=3003265 RepID=UPI0022AA4DF2|nr:LysR substrate-binding domain-containing protein [Aurantiacibacter sp. MUD11]WAT17495.1 LysR substrate-binding domain-containing protein [Aurantiacibacter sp. MUD11]
MSLARTIDPELLRAFVTVVDTGSFSAAARRLLRGQSAVSLQIKRLEEQLDTRLLNRTSRRVALTAEGEMVLGHARTLLRLNEQLLDRAREPELAGLVRIGAPEDFATTRLPRILAEFRESYPRVALEVVCELTLDLLDRFHAGELDMALLKREPSVDVDGSPVWREKLVWACGSEREALLEEDALPLVCSPKPCVYRHRATSALDAVGRRWRVAYSCGSLAGNLAALRAGLGLAVLPRDMVPHEMLVVDEQRHSLPSLSDTEIALVTQQHLSSPALRLRDYVQHEIERVAATQE